MFKSFVASISLLHNNHIFPKYEPSALGGEHSPLEKLTCALKNNTAKMNANLLLLNKILKDYNGLINCTPYLILSYLKNKQNELLSGATQTVLSATLAQSNIHLTIFNHKMIWANLPTLPWWKKGKGNPGSGKVEGNVPKLFSHGPLEL